MRAAPPAVDELDALIRLLDDDTPEVRSQVSQRLGESNGDLSEWLAARPQELSRSEKTLLEQMLSPGRRKALTRDWIVPTGGAAALREDWDSFEALLRTLSDFLHDGITLRQPLSDALDLLAEEAGEDSVITGNDLREFLFESGRLQGNRADYYDPRNSDLAWSISEGRSNPLGLCLIFMLVARRLDLEVEGVNFPGHFLSRIFEDGFPLIIDCFDHGRVHAQAALIESAAELTRQQRSSLREATDPGTILIRLLNNLSAALENTGRREDADLVASLLKTL
ncbi:transglutaminase-like domain-containing protein [Luteolibacter sp. SL250]|uniref:transglutaminase-like domain-containing protein n=1 Tax=Luteolibacter sp. SL250 TaxID=2995170 RepID=UPI002271EF80|nr:transglutaminase-like domain-containing protein [Luteolibacter sp. SL250]WAC19394.1 transglutaminase-like domain-containing protein [Luteolibacter sp. SL250]